MLQAMANKLSNYVVTTHDLADWMIQCSKDPQMAREYTHQLVGVSSSLGTLTWLTQTMSGVFTLVVAALIFGGCYFAYQKLA